MKSVKEFTTLMSILGYTNVGRQFILSTANL